MGDDVVELAGDPVPLRHGSDPGVGLLLALPLRNRFEAQLRPFPGGTDLVARGPR